MADKIPEDEFNDMITVNDAAKLLALTPQAVSKHCRKGNLPSKRIGGMYFLTVRAVKEFDRHERKPGPKPKEKNQKP